MDVIESVIASEAAEAASAEEVKAEITADEAPVAKTEETTEGGDEPAKELSEVERLEAENKKIKNAISYRDKTVGKLRAQLEYERKQVEALKARQVGPAPKEEDFEGKPYGELLTATAKHAAKEEAHNEKVAEAEERVSQVEAAAREEAKAAVDTDAEVARKVFPDFEESIEKLATAKRADGQAVIPLAQAVQSAIEMSDNPAHTLYAISKEPGALEYLNSLPAIKAAMLVHDFSLKAANLPRIKTKSDAPTPVAAARGTAPGSKSIEQMSPQELIALTR